MASHRGSSGELLEATTTQSAAEDEDDLLLMQQEAQMRHTAGSSAFSTSSVDRFLRDNGFQIDQFDGDEDVLSSSADGEYAVATGVVAMSPHGAADEDAAAAVEALLSVEVIDETSPRDAYSHDRFDDVLSSDDGSGHSSAAAGEGDLPTPRFILLDDEDLLSVSRQPDIDEHASEGTETRTADEWRRPMHRVERVGSSFDRSLLFGGASGLSALSEENPDAMTGSVEHSASHHVDNYMEGDRRGSPPLSSLSSSSSPHSSIGAPSSSGHDHSPLRRQDDELSDALGVRSSVTTPRERSTTESSRLSSWNRREPRRLSSHDEEEEEKVNVGPSRPTPNPWQTPPQDDNGAPEDDNANAQRSEWADVNVLLRKNGLPILQLQDVQVVHPRTNRPRAMVLPEHNAMILLVQEFVLQLDRKNETIQDLLIRSSQTDKVQSKAEDGLMALERKNEELRRSLQNAQNEIVRLHEEVRRQKEETDKQVKAVKSSCLKLQQQLKVSEHRVKAKEVLVERMQKKVEQAVAKEHQNKARDRKIFSQLHQRDPRKTSGKDTQSLEAIGVYETQREQMQQEIDNLRNQVAALNSELRDKDNYLSRRSTLSQHSGEWSDVDGRSSRHTGYHRPSDISDEMLVRLEAARREQEQAAAKLRQREAIMVSKISEIEKELLAARETINELKDENANLTLEAESRPSIRDYRLSQRRIHQLERQLSESKLALEEANDIQELRRFMGTTELIERDRLNHRLHLNRLSTLPKETLLEVVKEVCRVLNLTDITLITPSLHKLCNVVTAVPRMEKFIRDVCGFVYFNIGRHEEQPAEARFELEQVLPTLQQWMVERKKLHELEGFKAAIVTELCKRSIEPTVTEGSSNATKTTQLSSLPRAVQMVAELIELEKSVLHHKEIYTQAAEELERRPSVLVNQIVRHFSHLFHVRSVEGVLPKINEMYLFVNEVENFLKATRSLLNLKPDASLPACTEAIRLLAEGGPAQSKHLRPENDENANTANYVVEKSSRGQIGAASGGVEGVRQVREMSVLIRDLKKELGAATMQEILPRTKRLMELLSMSIHQSNDDF